jgi:hypothetical protein
VREPLRYREGTWHGRFDWAGRKLYMTVAGTAAGPEPSLEATLLRVVEDFDDVARAIEAFAAALVPDGRVRFRRRPAEAFAARDCGFARGGFYFDGITVAEHPGRAVVAFVTGEPDGYVSFVAELEAGRPIEITAEV